MRSDPPVRAAFSGLDPPTLVTRLGSDARFAGFRQALRRFLDETAIARR